MPTFHDPIQDGAEASEALRGLAHATRDLAHPADTYPVLGDLLAGVRSLRQVLDQLASTHLRFRAVAHDDDGNHLVGAYEALAAADELHQAGTLLDQAESRLDQAMQHSGRIAWHEAPPDPAPARQRLASRLGGFADPFGPRPPTEPRRARAPSVAVTDRRAGWRCAPDRHGHHRRHRRHRRAHDTGRDSHSDGVARHAAG